MRVVRFPTRQLYNRQCRYFSVKELSWCSGGSSKNNKSTQQNQQSETISCCPPPTKHNPNSNKNIITSESPYPNFAIIAAMLHPSRIIGINQFIPWDTTIPPFSRDRQHFVKKTKHQTLILGKNSFYENNTNFHHLEHLQHVIVVSRTIIWSELLKEVRSKQQDGNNNDDENDSEVLIGTSSTKNNDSVDDDGGPLRIGNDTQVHLARSFNAALEIANNLPRNKKNDNEIIETSSATTTNTNTLGEQDINCWVGGGQRIYEEAIRHPNALELYLTLVENIKEGQGGKDQYDYSSTGNQHDSIAFFPAKYRYDHKFEEVKKDNNVLEKQEEATNEEKDNDDEKDQDFRLTFLRYRRKRK